MSDIAVFFIIISAVLFFSIIVVIFSCIRPTRFEKQQEDIEQEKFISEVNKRNSH